MALGVDPSSTVTHTVQSVLQSDCIVKVIVLNIDHYFNNHTINFDYFIFLNPVWRCAQADFYSILNCIYFSVCIYICVFFKVIYILLTPVLIVMVVQDSTAAEGENIKMYHSRVVGMSCTVVETFRHLAMFI